jgi:hypothetical protein
MMSKFRSCWQQRTAIAYPPELATTTPAEVKPGSSCSKRQKARVSRPAPIISIAISSISETMSNPRRSAGHYPQEHPARDRPEPIGTSRDIIQEIA